MKRPVVSPAYGEPVVWNELTLYPFAPSAEGQARAVELADAASTYEDDENNLALALLVAGIAAVRNEGDRHAAAYFAIERVLSKTPHVVRAMSRYMAENRDKQIVGSV